MTANMVCLCMAKPTNNLDIAFMLDLERGGFDHAA